MAASVCVASYDIHYFASVGNICHLSCVRDTDFVAPSFVANDNDSQDVLMQSDTGSVFANEAEVRTLKTASSQLHSFLKLTQATSVLKGRSLMKMFYSRLSS